MKKLLSLVISAVLLVAAFAMPVGATTATPRYTDGEIIYVQNFDTLRDTDTAETILSSLGWRIENGEATSTALYSAKNGKFCIDNESPSSKTYSLLTIYEDECLKDLVKQVYTARMEITCVGTALTNYCNIILNYDGVTTYQSPMFRGDGTYRNQVRVGSSWYDWDGLSNTWIPTYIGLVDNKITNVVIRLVSHPTEGIYMYVNDVLVSAPNTVIGSAFTAGVPTLPGEMESYKIGLRTQSNGNYEIDNIAIYAGDGTKITPDLSAYGFTELAPIAETTAEETTKAPDVTTKAPDVTTAAPDVTTAAPASDDTTAAGETPEATTAAPVTDEGCGSFTALSVVAAIVPAAFLFIKKKH